MLTRIIDGDTTTYYQGDRLILTMEEPEKDGRVFMILKGELTMLVAPQVLDELDDFSSAGVPVTMDLKEVTYCSATALNLLVGSQSLIDSFQRGDLILTNVPDPIYEMMDSHNIADLFYIEEQGDA